jgi:periplasmic protein CpxP/Spy
MKRIFVLLAITFMGQLVSAQEKESAPTDQNSTKTEKNGFHKGKHKKDAMMKELNLSEDQKAKLKEMREANKGKRDAIKNDSKLTDDQKKEKMKALKDEQKKNMQGVLTDEQKAKMKEMKSKMKDEKKDRKKMRGNKADDATKQDVKTPAQ